ncbi:glycoside hydrolase family 13 protein [Desarmillaria tabescens]|uniref:alpha-amylase n=1 Tax=Armillaria tabescens TaxID=1929756 RepID=A0AA39JVQ9_ARMTA|nr:glycoside hydrolase family 13 protein [Desarmillaria tabescens]KAK0448344.1 glycoside hydrolase family 13 protein [Desarmillaria tabescens]
MRLHWPLTLLPLVLPHAFAATADQWRGRSIYQLITDRFALEDGANLDACNPADQDYCGGTWNTIRNKLDYIQNAGFTAIWISPVNQNYEGDRTPYGYPYHGYWMADITQLNDRFGTEDDLRALISDLHARDMYLMVDVVVNNVMALSTNPDYSGYMFKDSSYYHPYCAIDWGNTTSEQDCWLGDEKVTLPDLDTTNPTVVSGYVDWIKKFVQEYDIDGLRIDAAKHVDMEFWPQFCGSAGVFCMGEVFGGIDVEPVAQYQGSQGLDSVLNFPLQAALLAAFQIPGDLNVTALADVFEQSKKLFADTTLLGNFLENQDVSRWANVSVDPQTMYNAMTFTFMSDGIPIVYYGQEQSFSGSGDPYNREPLWPSGYQETYAYTLIQKLNAARNFLVSNTSQTDWLTSETEILTQSPHGVAIMKGPVITILTNIGSPAQNGTNIAVQTPYDSQTAFFDIFDCDQWVVGSQGSLDVEYTKGGRPVVLVRSDVLELSDICSDQVGVGIVHAAGTSASSTSSGARVGIQQLAWWWIALMLPTFWLWT